MYDIDLIKKIIPTLTFPFPYSPEDYAENFYLENYHKHTCFSNHGLKDSAESYENYISKIKELGAKCLFSTEHGWQGDHIAVYDLSQEVGLKYRHATEAYWVKDRHEKDKTNCHMVIVAKTAKGRKRLNYILSIANTEGFYGRARIDLNLLLAESPKDFIITSACVAGWKYEDADEIWLKIAKHYGDNFFFEVQNHNTDAQKRLNKHILELAKKHNIQIIVGLDSHYVSPESSSERDAVLESSHIVYEDEAGWYMDYPNTSTVIKRFEEQGVLSQEQIYRAIMNTNVFVEECEEIHLDRSFKIPNIYRGKTYDERVQIYKDLLNEAYTKEKVKSKERIEGIRLEAKEVIDSEVVDYFLLNHGLIHSAVNDYGGILTTTSRGSMGSFYTNKLLGSTTLDRFSADVPIYYPRFLTAERVLSGSMPDEDLNVAAQEPFIQAARKYLGEHGCYPLMAIEKFKPKSAWKMFARVNNITPDEAGEVSKCIEQYEKALKEAGDSADDIDINDFIPQKYTEIYTQSIKYQGVVSNFKVHACGFLLYDGDIREEIGLMSAISENTNKRTLCACVQGGFLDAYGYVKDDFLIVDTVSLTHELFQSIGREVPTLDELKDMVKDDQKTWDIYAKGITCCVNQLEREGTKHNMMEYKATNIAELSSFVAAIRPGFKSLLRTYIERKPYSTGEPRIDELLSETSHFMLYQESIMKVLSFLGVDMSETYSIIKAISKKKLKGEKKDKLEAKLKNSWMANFGNLDNFEAVWNVINDAARYSFNSPHAYSVASDSLYTAWFKAHHTAKFYEVAITHYQNKNNKVKMAAIINEATTYFGYRKMPLTFGDDNRKVQVHGEEKKILMCLSAVKGLSKNAADILYNAKDGAYNSFIDVIENVPLDKKNYEILIKLGYFRNYGKSQKLMETYEIYRKWIDRKTIKKSETSFPIELLDKYCSANTPSTYRFESLKPLLEEYCNKIPNEDISITEKVKAQLEYLGSITATEDPNYLKVGYVEKVFPKKRKSDKKICGFSYIITFLCHGKRTEFTYWNTKSKIKEGDVIEVVDYKPEMYQNKKTFILREFKCLS